MIQMATVCGSARTHRQEPDQRWLRVLKLREATSADRDFLWEVQRTAMRPAVEATWGWDEAFQARYFAEHFATEDRFIVCIDGADAGVLHFIVREDHVFLSSVALLPQHQGESETHVHMERAGGHAHAWGSPC